MSTYLLAFIAGNLVVISIAVARIAAAVAPRATRPVTAEKPRTRRGMALGDMS